MNETVSKVVDAIPATIWVALMLAAFAALSWVVKGQIDQDRQIAVLIEKDRIHDAQILNLQKRQDTIVQYLSPHPALGQ